MRRTVGKKWKKVIIAALCGCLLLAKETYASAATEAVYEYDVERGESQVYRGVISTYGLNVRSGAGKDNPVVEVDGEQITLDKDDEVAILDQAVNSGQVWYKVSFLRNEKIIVGYVHSSYVNLTVDVVPPLATPTPIPTPSPMPTPTTAPEPETPTPTVAPPVDDTEDNGGGGGLVAVLVVIVIAVGAFVMLWYVKKRNDDMKKNEASEKLDNLKNAPLSNAPLSVDGTPIPVMKRREQPVQDTFEETRRYPAEHRDEASILADKERARLMNEEMIRQSRNGGNEEEDARLREIAANLKEKEVLKEEIDRLHIGDMVYHEYFGKGIVRDNSDVKVIEISFGQDVRFLNKASCASKRLLRKL
mgnify:CR=1 FL=1